MVSQPWWDAAVPLFVSIRRLRDRKTLPAARAPWALDSGGFTELSRYGRWMTRESQYVEEVARVAAIGRLAWVAPQDWMCEPWIVRETGLSVAEHQSRTVASFLSLRSALGPLVIPVLQGYGPRDYDRCIELYRDAGVALDREPVVGLGSVCRRSRSREAVALIRYLSDHRLQLHGFGLKGTVIHAAARHLASADSMAWSFAARYEGRDRNSLTEALAWRAAQLA